jgi:peptide/nickel transport system substrate-binding protein
LTGGTALLAGCGGNERPEPGPGTGDDATGGGQGETTEFVLPCPAPNPTDAQWNKYYYQPTQTHVEKLITEPLVRGGPYPQDVDTTDLPRYPTELAADFTREGETLTVRLPSDRTWHNGDPLVAEDVLTQYRLEQRLGQSSGNVWEEIAAPDEQTVEFTLVSENINSDVVFPQLLVPLVRVKHDTQYGDFLETLESATTEEERQSASQEVVRTRLEERIGYGPWTVDSVTSSKISLSLYEDHPSAEDITFDRISLEAIPQNNKRNLSLREGHIDALSGTKPPEDIQDQFPDHIERIAYSGLRGDAIWINHGREPLSDRRVRQAIAHLIDRERNAFNAKTAITVPKYLTGLPNQVLAEWVGSDPEGFETYGWNASQTEAASRLLREAGYERVDGTWQSEDGTALSLRITTPGSGSWPLNAQTAVASLQDAGIDAQTRIRDKAGYGEAIQTGDFDMAINIWGGANGRGSHPYNFFSFQFEEQATNNMNYDATAVDIPHPVGEPDGDVQTVNVREKVEALGRASGEAETALIRELAWAYNQSIPRIPLLTNTNLRFISTDEWTLPARSDPTMKDNPVFKLLRAGTVRRR